VKDLIDAFKTTSLPSCLPIFTHFFNFRISLYQKSFLPTSSIVDDWKNGHFERLSVLVDCESFLTADACRQQHANLCLWNEDTSSVVTERCVNGCKDGWHGIDCATRCTSNCAKCDDNDRCLACVKGLWGDDCGVRCQYCSPCDRNSGAACRRNDCDDAYWTRDATHACQQACAEHCKPDKPGRRCDTATGVCLSCSDPDYDGAQCRTSIATIIVGIVMASIIGGCCIWFCVLECIVRARNRRDERNLNQHESNADNQNEIPSSWTRINNDESETPQHHDETNENDINLQVFNNDSNNQTLQ
jgi:hypothetical protein